MAIPPSEESPPGTPRIVRAYAVVHLVALAAFWFVPVGGWVHAFWQMVVTSLSAVFLVVGARRLRPERAVAWWFIAAGMAVNSSGVVVDLILFRFLGIRQSPNAADAFWSALFPAVVIGLSLLVRRAVAREDASAVLRNTVICVPITFFAGIHAWQFLAWRTYHDEHAALIYKIVVTAYPFGDLMFLALLAAPAAEHRAAERLHEVDGGLVDLLLPSDIGWPIFVRSGINPSHPVQYFMEATWMLACALMGAATWHPDVRELSRSVDGEVPALGALGWVGRLACVLMAPLVVLLQALLDRLYFLTSF